MDGFANKIGCLFISMTLSTALAYSETETPPHTLTWEECVQLAALNNPDLQASFRNVERTDASRKGAYSTLFPQISASYGATRSYSGSSSSGGLTSPSQYSNAYEAQINLSQTIFDGFKTKAEIDQARAGWNLAIAQLNAQKATTSFDLKSAFAQLLYSQELIRINQSIVDLRKRNVRLINLFYESGRENKGALLLSQANLTEAEFSYQQALRNRDVSERQLVDAMGHPEPSPLLAQGELVTQVLPPSPDFDVLALKTPSHHQQQAQVAAAAAGLSIAQADLYPTVTANGSASRQGQENFPRQNAWSAGFTATLPIFEGGQTYFNIRAARASLQQNLEQLRGTIAQAALTLAQDFKAYVDAVDQVRVNQELLAATKMRYQISEAEYRNGLISFQDFDTITTTYVNQEQSYLISRRDAVIAEATWEQACGSGAIP